MTYIPSAPTPKRAFEQHLKASFWNDFNAQEDLHYKPEPHICEETKRRFEENRKEQETGTIQDFLTQDNTNKKESPYSKIAREIAGLVSEKQIAYGDSFGRAGEVLKVLYPNGITPDQLGDALTITRIVDKLFRIANRKDAFGESPYRDIIGYGLLAVARDENGT